MVRVKPRTELVNYAHGREPSPHGSLLVCLCRVREELPSYFPHCIQLSRGVTSLSYEWLWVFCVRMDNHTAKGHNLRSLRSPHTEMFSVLQSVSALYGAVTAKCPGAPTTRLKGFLVWPCTSQLMMIHWHIWVYASCVTCTVPTPPRINM